MYVVVVWFCVLLYLSQILPINAKSAYVLWLFDVFEEGDFRLPGSYREEKNIIGRILEIWVFLYFTS